VALPAPALVITWPLQILVFTAGLPGVVNLAFLAIAGPGPSIAARW
jgi:hypothetical protein